MSKNNPYSELIKIINKEETIGSERKGDTVYLMNCHWVIKLPASHFNTFILPDCLRLIPLEDGEKACIRNDKKGRVEKRPDAFNVASLMDQQQKNNYNVPAWVTPFKFILDDGRQAVIISSEVSYHLINEKYYTAAVNICGSEAVYVDSESENSPILFKDSMNDTEFMILPLGRTGIFESVARLAETITRFNNVGR